MDGFYEGEDSLFVEAYDVFYGTELPQFAGDTAFYERLAAQAGGATLELACGTGRIMLELAKAGHEVTGVDLSEAMLVTARRKAAALPDEAQRRLALVRQDMCKLELDRQFGFVFIPFRSFQHLLTVDHQMAALGAIRGHLQPGGRLALHLFDPRLDLLIDEHSTIPGHTGTHQETGRQYVGEIVRTRFDHLAQTRHDLWRYCEIGPSGDTLREETREMILRWTYRWELRHLLAHCGFTVEAEYSDFTGTPSVYGNELIIIAATA